MEYTEDQLSGWIDALEQKPSHKGVYHVKVLHTEFEDDYSFFDGKRWMGISCSIENAADRDDETSCEIESWRGLSSEPSIPSAPKTRAGNKRKTMYVVMDYSMPVAAFHKPENADAYIKLMGFGVVNKIRFRTPEA